MRLTPLLYLTGTGVVHVLFRLLLGVVLRAVGNWLVAAGFGLVDGHLEQGLCGHIRQHQTD